MRVNIFAKFIGLLEGNANFTKEEFNKYIEVSDFIQQGQALGVATF